MSKQNLFTKKLKKQFLSINDSIENYFNRLSIFFSNIKKTKLSENNRVILSIGTIVILSFKSDLLSHALLMMLLISIYANIIINFNGSIL